MRDFDPNEYELVVVCDPRPIVGDRQLSPAHRRRVVAADTKPAKSAPDLRQQTIDVSSGGYDAARRQGKVLCDRRAWIDDDLRTLGFELLADTERAGLPAD